MAIPITHQHDRKIFIHIGGHNRQLEVAGFSFEHELSFNRLFIQADYLSTYKAWRAARAALNAWAWNKMWPDFKYYAKICELMAERIKYEGV